MRADEALQRLGGVASASVLLTLTSRRKLRAALRSGAVVRSTRGSYALPTASDARRAAGRLTAVVWLRSAAAHHGWALKTQPELPEVAVDRKRQVPPERRRDVRLSWVDMAADDRQAGVTSPLRTVIDCSRHLPFDEALAIVDSALRSGAVTRDELRAVSVRGAGSAAVRRVLEHADGRAANPFESVLRAYLIEAGLVVEAQAPVELETGTVHPDVVSRSAGAVFEADSWTHHATRKAHRSDCARYNMLVLAGWRVFRFTWEQVMLEPAYVRWVLARVTRRVEQAEVGQELGRPA
ncbi:endonuclease domain-containing protein [Nocardioides coralli]|uniref:endonuclease domain-containing protein n=1 Tax=Nocardioides coralli TaxID=2872154 RepID=UPI001CA3D20A|nr:endonuclease domain-containing protein [Nocardioides coralli]QZY30373.1 endonuclease domain-containing protein [Nocardioides coralli]